MELFATLPDRGKFTLAVKVIPNARNNQISGISPEVDGNPLLKISVTAVPENGKANAAMIKLLAKSLKIAKGDIEIVAGQTSRNKKLRIRGDEAALISQIQKLTQKGK